MKAAEDAMLMIMIKKIGNSPCIACDDCDAAGDGSYRFITFVSPQGSQMCAVILQDLHSCHPSTCCSIYN